MGDIAVSKENIVIENRRGWSDTSLHNIALIFEENPYILVILTNRSYTEYESFFKDISNLTYNFHIAYWNQQTTKCLN